MVDQIKRLRSAFALVCLLWLSAGANAAGEPPRFDGIYGGFVAGYGFIDDADIVYNGNPVAGFDLDGPLAGLTGGWNWNNGTLLLGLEADGQALGMQDTANCNGFCSVTADIDALVTARARVGVLLGEENQFAAYATGGLALVWIGLRNNIGFVGTTEGVDATYAVGAGIEGYLFETDWMSTKLEYLYVGLDANRNGFLLNTADRGNFSFDGMHLIRWGLNIHFN